MKIDIHLVRNAGEQEEVFWVREVVFIEGQGVPWEEEMDGLDEGALQVIARQDGTAVGCARLRLKGREAKLERIAVLPEYRGKGIGKAIVAFLVALAAERGAAEAVMHAQCAAGDFYAKCGFRPRGEEFSEAGIRHIEMFREINLQKATHPKEHSPDGR